MNFEGICKLYYVCMSGNTEKSIDKSGRSFGK